MTHPPQGSDQGRDEAGPSLPGPGMAPPQGYGQSSGQRPQYAPPPPSGMPQPYGQPGQYGAQPYGPPGYAPPGMPGQQFGPPPGPPAPTSRVGLIAVLTGMVLIVIAAAVVLVMNLRTTVLDAASAERDVAAQFERREGVAVDLDCPSDMVVTGGATYTCTGKTADGEAVTLRLTITDARIAAYTWTEP